MKDAYDIFLNDPEFYSYCVFDYQRKLTVNNMHGCCQPLTPLSMYYASKWDKVKVALVIKELKDHAKVELFNSLILCFTQGLYCNKGAPF